MAERGQRILAIDDDEHIRLVVATQLQMAGYTTVSAVDGREGLRRFYGEQPDLVVLDVSMPSMDGWQVLERIRELSEVPVLMLTAADQERDKVKGLRGGADDYITKPFSADEFLARVEAALRRSSRTAGDTAPDVYRDSEITINFAEHQVLVRDRQIALSPTEYRLLRTLVQQPNRVLSQEQLLKTAWGQDYDYSPEVVRMYIGYLRNKIERDPGAPKLIETVRGFGYRYKTPEV